MKIHVGADANSGLAHTVAVTAANEADVSQLPNLLREDDRDVFGDKGYVDNRLKRAAWKAGVFCGVALKSGTTHKLSASNKRFIHKMSSVRSRVEHLFRVIKRQFGYTKVRYKGLEKNAAQVFPPDRADQSLSGEASHIDVSAKGAPAAPEKDAAGDRKPGTPRGNGTFVVAS